VFVTGNGQSEFPESIDIHPVSGRTARKVHGQQRSSIKKERHLALVVCGNTFWVIVTWIKIRYTRPADVAELSLRPICELRYMILINWILFCPHSTILFLYTPDAHQVDTMTYGGNFSTRSSRGF